MNVAVDDLKRGGAFLRRAARGVLRFDIHGICSVAPGGKSLLLM
jgi:hypothetical protein